MHQQRGQENDVNYGLKCPHTHCLSLPNDCRKSNGLFSTPISTETWPTFDILDSKIQTNGCTTTRDDFGRGPAEDVINHYDKSSSSLKRSHGNDLSALASSLKKRDNFNHPLTTGGFKSSITDWSESGVTDLLSERPIVWICLSITLRRKIRGSSQISTRKISFIPQILYPKKDHQIDLIRLPPSLGESEHPVLRIDVTVR